MTALLPIALTTIPAAPYVGQEVFVEGKIRAVVRAVCRHTEMAAVRTAAGELVAVPFIWLQVEER